MRVFIHTCRKLLLRFTTVHLLSVVVDINKRRGKLTPLRKTTPQSFDAGIQVAKVNQQGQLHMSLALGCVAYTSWQPLHDSDPFPYGSPDNLVFI